MLHLELGSKFLKINIDSLDEFRTNSIINTLDCYNIISDLTEELSHQFLLTGGFPLALFTAPIKDELIEESFYKDIDFLTTTSQNSIVKYLAHKNGLDLVFESDLALTFENQYMEAQYLIGHTCQSLDYLDVYDIVNCKITYDPCSECFYFDRNIPELISQKRLQISPWLLNNSLDNYLDRNHERALYRTVNRIIKYGVRWNWHLTSDQEIQWFLEAFDKVKHMYKNSKHLPGYNSVSLLTNIKDTTKLTTKDAFIQNAFLWMSSPDLNWSDVTKQQFMKLLEGIS